MKKFFAILIVMTMIVTLFACGAKTEAPAADADTDQPAADAPAEETPAAADSDVEKDFDLTSVKDFAADVDTEGMTFYWVAKVLGGTYWTGVETGQAAAAEELGIEVKKMGVEKETDIEQQINNLQNALAAAPDAIMAAPCDSKALDAPIKEAAEAFEGPIVLIDTVIATEGGYDVAILTDNGNAGATMARLLMAGLVEKGYTTGKVGLECVNTGSQTVIDRQTGFKEYWDANAADQGLGDIEVLWNDIKVSEGDSNVALSSGQDFQTAYSDLVGMAGFNGDSVYFLTSLKEAGNKDIVGVGMDFNVDSYALMEEGWEYASVAQSTYNMGYYGVYLSVAILAGQDYEGTRIDSGLLEVTQDNLTSKEVTDYVDLLRSASK